MNTSEPTTIWCRPLAHPLMLCMILLTGCHAEKKEQVEVPAAAKIEGDTIIFPADNPQQAALTVETVRPVKKSVIHVNGHLGWYEDATVRVFASVAGRVDKICVSIGQKVSVGDTLAMIASPDFGQAQADASRARSDLALSNRTLTRLRDLFANGAAARKDVEAAENDFEAKTSENERALARLRLYGVVAGSVDGHYPLNAPVAGTVVDKTINPGQEVRPDQMLANAPQLFAPLFIVSDPRRLAVQLDITELETGALKAGQTLRVRTKAHPDKVFHGHLEFIGDTLDPLTRIVKARGIVDNSEGLLRAEMYVSVDVDEDGEAAAPKETDGVVDVPSAAVFSKDNKHFVYVEKSPGEYQRQEVVVGREHDGMIIVGKGLAAGQRIVIDGCLLLQSMTEAAKE